MFGATAAEAENTPSGNFVTAVKRRILKDLDIILVKSILKKNSTESEEVIVLVFCTRCLCFALQRSTAKQPGMGRPFLLQR